MKSQVFLMVMLLEIYSSQTFHHAKAFQASFRVDSSETTTDSDEKDIRNLENEFTSTYSRYMTLHARNVHNITKQELKKDLEAFDKRSLVKETRFRRSGACAEICIHRCLPSCNLACCVERPKGINRHIINKMEVEAAKKMADTGSKKNLVGFFGSKDKYLSKKDMEKGRKCEKKCQIHCDPSCKFKCCIRVHRG